MIFNETKIQGVYLIELEMIKDARGFFARSFCANEFKKHGLNTNPVQSNISFNDRKGTLRGMHFQNEPHGEAKLVRCTTGVIYDVVVDLRKDSSTYCEWVGFELSSDKRNALYIPEGIAHGFQTLDDNTEVFYQMYNYYEPSSADGVRFNDPTFNITWPIKDYIISEKDLNYSDFAA